MHASTRPAAVAGMFYPREPGRLGAEVRELLARADARHADVAPKVLVVPHAGYRYSGAVAATGYRQIEGLAGRVTRVVLIGPAHRVALRGLAAPASTAFETPLGPVPVDVDAIDRLADLPQVLRDDRAHTAEHALEVQLPFLQAVLGSGFRLVPLVVGRADAADVAEVLERLWGGPETLIVVSTDLSHYLPDEAARLTDRHTASRIAALATDLDPYEACGAHALNGALLCARRHGLRAELLDLRNSGDTSGDRQRVVGYASLALREPAGVDEADVDDAAAIAAAAQAHGEALLGQALLARAHNRIASALGHAHEPEPVHPALSRPGATFVTLRDAAGALRGCIGRLTATRPLADDVSHNAAAAAFEDPRFAPLAAEEWEGLRIEVSLLGEPTPLPAMATLQEAAGTLVSGEDGVILEWQGHRATFLPQVWEQLPRAEPFLRQLLRKAGLPEGFWSPEVRLHRYRVRKFERAPVAPRPEGAR